MKRAPTDLEILNAIHERYYDAFISFDAAAPNRDSKLYVPIDIKELAGRLQVDADIVFGRLNYDLEKKYGYKQDDGTTVPFFAPRIGGDKHCVNFPYVSAVLAARRDEDRKYRLATTISMVSLFLSLISLVLSLVLHTG